jgi:hypothetical protein
VPLWKRVYTEYSKNKNAPLVTMQARYLMSLEALIWSLPAQFPPTLHFTFYFLEKQNNLGFYAGSV